MERTPIQQDERTRSEVLNDLREFTIKNTDTSEVMNFADWLVDNDVSGIPFLADEATNPNVAVHIVSDEAGKELTNHEANICVLTFNLTWNSFRVNGVNTFTGTRYDREGYNQEGDDPDGVNRAGWYFEDGRYQKVGA